MEEMPQLEDSPHDAEAFALCCGVVLLCSSESSAAISERMKQFARFLLEEGTLNLVGACVHVNDELPIGFWQESTSGHKSALRRSSKAAMATSVGGGRSGGISALVRAFRD